MKCSGVWSSGTGYITFEDVKVPVENLIGKENSGFKYIMYNFNHERFMLVVRPEFDQLSPLQSIDFPSPEVILLLILMLVLF